MMRGLVSCTGIDYCHMALIETKELALKTARELEQEFGQHKKMLTMHWSGCPAGCGNHAAATSACSERTSKSATRWWMPWTCSSGGDPALDDTVKV